MDIKGQPLFYGLGKHAIWKSVEFVQIFVLASSDRIQLLPRPKGGGEQVWQFQPWAVWDGAFTSRLSGHVVPLPPRDNIPSVLSPAPLVSPFFSPLPPMS